MATHKLFNAINAGDEGKSHLLARAIDPESNQQKKFRPRNVIKIHGTING